MSTASNAHSWRESISVYRQPKVLTMLFLGFSAGLPFLLVFTTLTLWLSEAGVSKTTIGFFAWIGITYSIKVFWAPVVDRLRLPLLTARFGQRRGWMLLAQTGIAAGLLAMAFTEPASELWWMAVFGLVVAFSSATQDICIDAFRIESATGEWQAAMAANYILGYRLATLATGAGALYAAELMSWTMAYLIMAGLVSVGMVTVLLVREPQRHVSDDTWAQEERVSRFIQERAHWPKKLRDAGAWFTGAVVCPFVDFFTRNGAMAITILVFISIYRLSDVAMAGMTMPFYSDLGFSKSEIATITKFYGFFMTIFGAFAGGVFVMRYGLMRCLLGGAVALAVTNLLFAYMATLGHDILWLTILISGDNFSNGFASTTFIAYLSSLTSTAYTATQYALFSSLMTLPAKVTSGFSGIVVDAYGFASFFIYAAGLGIPAILMVLFLMKKLGAPDTAKQPGTEAAR